MGELTPDQGWDVLREISQHTNIKLRHVSELLIEWARTGNLCTDIRTGLDRQLKQHPHTRPQQSGG
ncbi:ANTAR domain-containing protein [Streptomyces sp. NPDC093509]|uniref:ANTAR domain-containing protein n=1 Tax=Streptomyces sp. NPDC093509 TaxID=3154982 RepID=UPI003450080F